MAIEDEAQKKLVCLVGSRATQDAPDKPILLGSIETSKTRLTIIMWIEHDNELRPNSVLRSRAPKERKELCLVVGSS